MNLPRIALVAVLVALVSMGSCAVQSCRLADRDARIAVAASEKVGFTASTGRPKIPDLPRGVKSIATVEGGVRYLPRRAGIPGSTSATVRENPGPGCDLDALTVSLDCRAEVANAGGTGVARLWVHGLLRDGDRSREFPWARVGDPVLVTPPGEPPQPVETREPEVHVNAPPPADRFALGLRRPSAWRSGWVLGAGFSYDPFDGRTAPAVFVGYGIQF